MKPSKKIFELKDVGYQANHIYEFMVGKTKIRFIRKQLLTNAVASCKLRYAKIVQNEW